MTEVQTNNDLRDALEFYAYVNGIKEKKDEWTAHGDLLKRVLDRLYDTPGYRSHFSGFDDSLAYLSYDIVGEVVKSIGEPAQLGLLEEVHGTWGALASKQQTFLEEHGPQYADASFSHEDSPFYERWERLLRKAPRLHGKLHLSGLCGYLGSGEELYAALKPQFYYVQLEYHRTVKKRATEELEHLRGFLKRQLQSPCLRKLHLEIIGDLDLEAELLTFCLSRKFESLEWTCGPLTTDFFVRVYNAYNSKQIAPDGKRKLIGAFLDRPALKKIVQTLKLKRQEKDCYWNKFKREERTAVSDLSIVLYFKKTKTVYITIEWKPANGCSKSSTVPELQEISAETPPKKQKITEETEEDFADFDDYDHDCPDNEYCCDGTCDLRGMDPDYWTDDDCADCAGCHLCNLEPESTCPHCGYACRCRDFCSDY